MKHLKMLLTLLFTSILFIPKTFAFEVDGALFDNVKVYNSSNNTLVYSVTDNVNSSIELSANQNISYYFNIKASDASSVSTSQLLLYTNICTSNPGLQLFDKIENTTGSISKLQLIANNVGSNNSCKLKSGYDGFLIQNVYSFAYSLERQSSGYSFLNSKIYWKSSRTLSYYSFTDFINIYISNYDENIIQNLKQQQINEQTNTYLQQQINEQQSTNNKLDSANNKLDSILDDSSPELDILGDTSTWLPPGPIDSIIMLPLNFINTIVNKISGTCSPVNLPIPFMNNKYIVLPCLNTIFEQIEGFSTLFNLIGVIGSVYLLYNYFVRFYKWVDDTLTLRENTWNDWGGD